MPYPTIDRFSDKDVDGRWKHSVLSNGHVGEPIVVDYTQWVTQDGWLFPDGNVVEYQTSEHLYQALKGQNTHDHLWVASAARAFGRDGAKERGRSIEAWPDWEERKYDAMRFTLRMKFTLERADGQFLLRTGNMMLEEGNTWKDTCWGIDRNLGFGRNWLGHLLMARRAELLSLM